MTELTVFIQQEIQKGNKKIEKELNDKLELKQDKPEPEEPEPELGNNAEPIVEYNEDEPD